MHWRLGILAALLAWLILAIPAGAAIQRHTDSQGIIHINNVAAPRPAPSYQESLAEQPGPAMASLPEPAAPAAKLVEAAPATAAAVAPRVSETSPAAVEQGSEVAEKGQVGLGTPDQVCQSPAGEVTNPPAQGIIGMMAAAASIAAKTVAPAAALPENAEATAPGALPALVQLASTEGDQDAATRLLAPRAAAPKAPEIFTSGEIRRSRDARGVWHISNVTPGNEGAAPAGLEATKTPGSPRTSPETPPHRAAGPPLQRVAWSQDNPDLATLPTAKIKAMTAAPEPLNLIRRYRDSKGVIHICNVEPEDTAPRPAAGRQVQADLEVPAPRRRALTLVAAQAPLALKPAAWSGEPGVKPLKLVKAGSAPQTEITTEGGIKRWRDKKGIWHIETVEYPLPAGVVLPPRQAGPPLAPPAVSAPGRVVPAVPLPLISPTPLLSQNATRVPTVTAFRDKQGRLRITNDAPVMLGKPPAGAAPAPAELEPLIVEAAQMHRLPPTLIRAVIKTESNFCSWAVSPKGAMGLMQLMPGTAAFLGVQEPFNPRENVRGGCRYLRLLIDLFGGNVPLALAAYNAGYQRVIDCGYQVPPIKETQEFVTQVMGRYVAEEHRTGQPWT